MALTVKQIVNRHGAVVSAVTGALVGSAIVVLGLLQTLIGFVSVLSYGLEPSSLGDALPATFGRLLLVAIPFALGFFVSLWIIAPIAEELRIPHVVTRAILATGVASTVAFVALAVAGVIGALSTDGSLYSQSIPQVMRFDGGQALSALLGALTGALLTFASNLPLGVLAAVLLWLWRKDHPPRHPLSGLIDEV